MANEEAVRDENRIPALLVTNASVITETLAVYGDPSTHALKVYIAGSDTGGDDINIAQVNGATVNVGTGAASTGTQRVTTSTDSTIGTLTGGGVASGATDSGNPIKVGGIYNSTAPTFTNGQRGDLQIDVKGNVNANLGTLISGEDQTNGVLKVEGQFSGTTCTADTQVKSSAGFLHSLTFYCTDAAPTAGSIIVYDNTAESGTVIVNFQVTTTFFNPFTLIFDRICTTGIYAGFTTTADVGVQANWR